MNKLTLNEPAITVCLQFLLKLGGGLLSMVKTKMISGKGEVHIMVKTTITVCLKVLFELEGGLLSMVKI